MTTPFAPDGAGGMLIVTSKGLFHWTSGAIRPLPLRNADLGGPTAVYRDPRGQLWVGTQRGLLSLTRRGNAFLDQLQPAIHGPVASILADSAGNLWIGTRGHGICRLAPHGVTHWTSAEGLADDTLRSIFEDNEGNLWFGMLSGGLSRWRETAIIPYGQPEGLPESFASTALSVRAGDLWLGTWVHGVFRLRHDHLTRVPLPGSPLQVPIRALADDHAGGMWIGTWYNGVYHFDGSAARRFVTGLESPSDAVSALLVSRAGSLWIGEAPHHGLLKYPGRLPPHGQEHVLLPGKLITAIAEDPSGRILVGTSQGLFFLDEAPPPGQGSFVTALTRKGGLSSDAVIISRFPSMAPAPFGLAPRLAASTASKVARPSTSPRTDSPPFLSFPCSRMARVRCGWVPLAVSCAFPLRSVARFEPRGPCLHHRPHRLRQKRWHAQQRVRRHGAAPGRARQRRKPVVRHG